MMQIAEYKRKILEIMSKDNTVPRMRIDSLLERDRILDSESDSKITKALEELIAEDLIHKTRPESDTFFTIGKNPANDD